MYRRFDLARQEAARSKAWAWGWLASGGFLLALVIATGPVFGETPPATSGSGDPREISAAKPANATNRFTIRGMHCNACAKGLTSELKRVPGVAAAEVSFTNRLAVVAYDTNRVAVSALLSTIKEAGFEGQLAKRPTRR